MLAPAASLFERFQTFLCTLRLLGESHLTDSENKQRLDGLLGNLQKLPPDPVGTEAALRTFFCNPPAHVMAVKALDHSQFVTPLSLASGAFPMGDVLHMFSGLGPKVYGTLWLHLLDVADLANDSITTQSGRQFLRGQIAGESNAPALPLATIPSVGQIEGMMSTVLGAFPGLQPAHPSVMNGPLPRCIYEAVKRRRKQWNIRRERCRGPCSKRTHGTSTGKPSGGPS